MRLRAVYLFLLMWIPCSVFAAGQSAVAMPDRFSADVAKHILEQGGNAVDAAIAAELVLAVTLPEAGNIGGGGFMLIYKDNKTDFIDYREKAPMAASRDMYLDENGNVIPGKSLYGIYASGVPGTVAGMWLAHKKHGSLPWATLVQPAVDLANKGFIMPRRLADYIHNYIKHVENVKVKSNFSHYFGSAKAGEIFKQPELAATLERIRDQGAKGFYQGKTADYFVKFEKKAGGLIRQKDLDGYQAKSRTPLQQKWQGYEVLTSPPPSSGGVAILQWLTMYTDVAKRYPHLQHNSAEYIHLLAEIGKRVFADRAKYLGDPDFVSVPVKQLLNPAYLARRAAPIRANKISTSEDIHGGLHRHESEETTHFSVLDKWGNAVSNTTTINLGFGSGVVVEGAGFILNNEMDDFSSKPGVPNVFGAIGGKANAIEAQKRMLSSMSPTILLKNGKVFMVTGSPGGTTIISSVYESILDATVYDMNATQTVNTPRFHHQLWPKNVIRHHAGLPVDVQNKLKAMGYTLDNRHFGDMQVIINRNGMPDAASEASGRGHSYVF